MLVLCCVSCYRLNWQTYQLIAVECSWFLSHTAFRIIFFWLRVNVKKKLFAFIVHLIIVIFKDSEAHLNKPKTMYDPLLSPVTLISCPGTQNYSGLSVFTAAPVEGSIAPGQSQDINVTFQPDHPSLYYSDRLTIELSNQVTTQRHTPRVQSFSQPDLGLNHFL